MGRTSESKYFTLTMWYKNPIEIILQALRQEIIQPLGIKIFPFHSKMGSFWKIEFYNCSSIINRRKPVILPINPLNENKIDHIKFYQINKSNAIGQLYWKISIYLFATTNSPTAIVMMKGSFRTSGKISNFLAIK